MASSAYPRTQARDKANYLISIRVVRYTFHSNHTVVTVAIKCPFSPLQSTAQLDDKEHLAQKVSDLHQTDRNESTETAKRRPCSL